MTTSPENSSPGVKTTYVMHGNGAFVMRLAHVAAHREMEKKELEKGGGEKGISYLA